MPSSVMFGSRPRICITPSYSAAERPCSAAISDVTLISMLAVAIFQICREGENSQGHEISCPCDEYAYLRCFQAVAFAEPTSDSTMERKITNPSVESSADF